MRAVLWGIALGSICLLQAAADLTVQPDFDPKKFAGKWVDIAIAFQNGDAGLKNENGHHIIVEATKEGNFYFTEVSPEENCTTGIYFFTKKGRPGIYTFGKSTLYILKTDYVNYVFMHVDQPGERILHLYARKHEVSEDIKEAFRKLAASLNLPAHNIVYFNKAAPCPI